MFVITGLDPAIHALRLIKRSLVGHADGRNQPGHDGYGFR
jgi:hypothetical protein